MTKVDRNANLSGNLPNLPKEPAPVAGFFVPEIRQGLFMDVSQAVSTLNQNKTATGLSAVLSAIVLAVLTGNVSIGELSAGEYATKTEFSGLQSTVQSQARAIKSNTEAVLVVTAQVGQMYEQNLGQDIFQQTKIMCGLATGTAIRDDYASRVTKARSLFIKAMNRQYPALNCIDLVK